MAAEKSEFLRVMATATSREHAATLLGVSTRTINRWICLYWQDVRQLKSAVREERAQIHRRLLNSAALTYTETKAQLEQLARPSYLLGFHKRKQQ